MPIINKGIFDTDTVFTRQTGNDWPTVQAISTADILDALTIGTIPGSIAVSANLVANGLIIRNINVSDSILTGNIVSTVTTSNVVVAESITSNTWNGIYTANVIETAGNLYFTAARVNATVRPMLTTANVVETSANLYFTNTRVVSALVAGDYVIIEANGRISANVGTVTVQAATQVNNLDNLTTSNLAEGSVNLYYSNARARSAFTAGKGILITEDGIVKSTIGSEIFNPAINYAKDYNVTATMAAALTIPSTPINDRYILRSMHITNISDSVAFVSSNVLYSGGNTAYLGSLIPVPVGSIVEFMDRPQLLQPGDRINIQGFNASQAATSGLLSSYFTYESISNDATYVGAGTTLATSNTNIQIVDADQSDTVIESIKVVNLKTYSIPVKVFFAYANATPKSYMAYNMPIPPNSSVELLQSPKLIYFTDKVFVNYANASDGDAISIFPSYRRNAITNQGNISTTSATPGSNIDISYFTTLLDGTTLYYTLE
jgi:hypothetical protein